jgi:U-box domain
MTLSCKTFEAESSSPQKGPTSKPDIDLGATTTTTTATTSASTGTTTTCMSSDIYPRVFYCHRTNVLMMDPVVGPDGESVERSAIDDESKDRSTPYYPNRALKAILQETSALLKGGGDSFSLRASWAQIQTSVSRSLRQILPESTSDALTFRPLNDAYYCPITLNLIHFPVIDPEGYTFERVALENWVRINGKSPITRATLSIDQLYVNKAIARLLQDEKEKPEDQMHPSVKKWKDEPAPRATDVELGGGALVEHQQQQQDHVFVVVNMTRNEPASYPTTPDEWNDRLERIRRNAYHGCAMAVAVAFLVLFFLSGHLFFLMLFTMTTLVVISKRTSD